MNTVNETTPQQRKKKMILFLPLMIVPLCTLLFWALGGGRAKTTEDAAKGLQLTLPDSSVRQENVLDKLGFYQQAEKDSIRRAEWMRSDPYYRQPITEEDSFGMPTTPVTSRPEDEVLQKLSKLQRELDKQSTPASGVPFSTGEADRLEAMMQQLRTQESDDPQIGQLSAVMDKILDMQHPERVKDRLKEKQPSPTSDTWSVLSSAANDSSANGFFSINAVNDQPSSNAIQAVIPEDQTLVNGSVIRLRLSQDIFINNERISNGTLIAGIVQLDAERLLVTISSIRHRQSLYKVDLTAHDMDGLPGIHIPGAVTREVAKQSADNSLQLMELSTVDPSLKAQAATAGINTLRSLFSRKVKLVKVTVKTGYRLLLMDKTTQQ
jgi:conjugative transposon TraM protein